MRIRMLKPHLAYKRGEIVDLPPTQAETMVTWEQAEYVRDETRLLVETAALDQHAETAEATPRKRRK